MADNVACEVIAGAGGDEVIPIQVQRELADPEELERQVFLDEWGPILALPCKGSNGVIRPAIDEFGHVDYRGIFPDLRAHPGVRSVHSFTGEPTRDRCSPEVSA